MTDKPVRDYDKFMLRFPDGMRDAIAERAKANGRSMNSEIIQILQEKLDLDKRTIIDGDGIPFTIPTDDEIDREISYANMTDDEKIAEALAEQGPVQAAILKWQLKSSKEMAKFIADELNLISDKKNTEDTSKK